jgi:hypothetical protein
MPEHEKLGTPQKALSLNLDNTIYGSFAEIGAGQEVARWFLRVGGASGTVAKTISAYDKEVSDQLYGTGTRYVSKARLEAMLDSEWAQLLWQLHATRGHDTRFFSFVDTISARNYAGTNDSHGWVGLRFLRQPGDAPNDVVLHINLRDPSNVQQQEAVGILGVNLIYAAHHALESPDTFLASVFEDLDLQRLEIDCVEFHGPAIGIWNREESHALLVVGGYAEAVAFSADNQLAPPNELLYKRALVLAPGRFDNVSDLHVSLIEKTLAQLPEEELKDSKGRLGLFCLSVAGRPLEKKVPVREVVEHVAELQRLGYGVIVFRAQELYRMSIFANRYTKSRIHFAIGLSVLLYVMEDSYQNLTGTLLEGIARLFAQNVRLSVYPMTARELEGRTQVGQFIGWRWKETDGVVSAENLLPAEPLDYLYRYLIGSKFILPAKLEGQ